MIHFLLKWSHFQGTAPHFRGGINLIFIGGPFSSLDVAPKTSTRAGLKPGQPEAPSRATYTNDSWSSSSWWDRGGARSDQMRHFFQKKTFCYVGDAEIQVPNFQDRFKLYHLFGTRFKSCIQYDAGFGHIDDRSGCFLEDEFHLHQGHFCHFNDYLRMRYETTSECLLDHPNRASMVFFVAGGEKSGKRCSMLKFGWPPPLSNHKTWSKLPWSPFFAISLTNAIPPTRWKVLQHAIPHHWCDEPTIHGPKFTITEASHRSACLVVVNPQWAERMRAIYLEDHPRTWIRAYSLENERMSPENQWLEDVVPMELVPF